MQYIRLFCDYLSMALGPVLTVALLWVFRAAAAATAPSGANGGWRAGARCTPRTIRMKKDEAAAYLEEEAAAAGDLVAGALCMRGLLQLAS